MTPLPVLYPGDCRETMAALAFAGETFDACVCDPPYDLVSVVKRFGKPGSAPAQHGRDGAFSRQSRGFMGKEWDGTGIAFDAATWRAAYDVLKPGAYLVAFGGTRTYHRMTCAIEDAGFEVRDCLFDLLSADARFLAFFESLNNAQAGAFLEIINGLGLQSLLAWIYGTGFPKSHDVSKAIDAHLGSGGAEAAAREGWGTALKPAVEPIVLARKPLVGTVAENVLTHGTGGINIDGCRIPLTPDDPLQDGVTGRDGRALDGSGAWGFKAVDRDPGLGRWPANVLHDGSAEVLSAFPAAPGQLAREKRDGSAKTRNVFGAMRRPSGPRMVAYSQPNMRGDNFNRAEGRQVRFGMPYGDSGSAARFFYSAKAAKADRLCGGIPTKHPTVKPIALMRWLCRLVTPPGGRILDPFAGSGTTLAAAHAEGFGAVGCEQDADYLPDIERRIAALALSDADADADLAAFVA